MPEPSHLHARAAGASRAPVLAWATLAFLAAAAAWALKVTSSLDAMSPGGLLASSIFVGAVTGMHLAARAKPFRVAARSAAGSALAGLVIGFVLRGLI